MPDGAIRTPLVPPEAVAVSLFTSLATRRGPVLLALSLVPLAVSFAAAAWRLLW